MFKNWEGPEVSIVGADQKDLASGDENGSTEFKCARAAECGYRSLTKLL